MEQPTLISRMFRKLNRYNLHGSCLKVELSQRIKVQKFFIGNVAFEATEEEIAEFFESYGVKVISCEEILKLMLKLFQRSSMLKTPTKGSDLFGLRTPKDFTRSTTS